MKGATLSTSADQCFYDVTGSTQAEKAAKAICNSGDPQLGRAKLRNFELGAMRACVRWEGRDAARRRN